MTELRAITEDNFLDAFHLRLAPGQERFVSHPIRLATGVEDEDEIELALSIKEV